MGDPKKKSKKFDKPLRPWDRARLSRERETKKTYGLKNKKELWRVETFLRNKRKNARKLLALEAEARAKRERELVKSIAKYGIITETAALDDVLGLGVESFLERRLQTIVWRKGLSLTAKQARQFIVHGHIAIRGKKVTRPNYLVNAVEENLVAYYGKPLVLETKKPEKEKLREDFEKAVPEEAGEEIGEAKEADVTEEEAVAEGTEQAESTPATEGKEKADGEEKALVANTAEEVNAE